MTGCPICFCSKIKEKIVFSLFFARLFVPLTAVEGNSARKIEEKNCFFFFVFRSLIRTFAE